MTLRGSVLPLPIPINELGKQLLKAAADGDKDEVKKLMSQGAPFTTDWVHSVTLIPNEAMNKYFAAWY